MSGDSNSVTVCRHCKREIARLGDRWTSVGESHSLYCPDNRITFAHEPAPAEQPRPNSCGCGLPEVYSIHLDKNSPVYHKYGEYRPVAASPAEGPRCPECRGELVQMQFGNEMFRSRSYWQCVNLNCHAKVRAAQPSPDAAAESDIERQIAICEQNGAKWCNFAVADVKKLLVRLDAAKVSVLCPVCHGKLYFWHGKGSDTIYISCQNHPHHRWNANDCDLNQFVVATPSL